MISKYFFGFKKDLIILLFAYLIYALCHWVLLLLFLKEDILLAGKYSYSLAFTGPIVSFSFLQLRVLYLSDLREDMKIQLFFIIRFLTTLLAIIFICLLAYFIVEDSSTYLVVLLVGISRSIEGLSDLVYGVYQRTNRILRMGISLSLRGIVPLAFLLLSNKFFNVNHFIYFNLIGILTIVLIDLKSINFSELGIKVFSSDVFNKLKSIFQNSIYLSTIGLFMSLIPNVPRYFIEYFKGFEELATFSSVGYILVLGTLISSAYSDSILFKLSKIVTDNLKLEFERFFYKLVVSIVFLGLFSFFISYFICFNFTNILEMAFNVSLSKVFFVIAITLPFQIATGIFMTVLISLKFVKYQLMVYSLQLFTLIAVCYFAIPRYGILGASYSLLCIFVLTTFFLYILIRIRTRIVFENNFITEKSDRNLYKI